MSSPTTGSTSTCVPGEVHALLGENGAGKSYADVRSCMGSITPDEGEIRVNDELVTVDSPAKRGSKLGIGMVHQHFMLVPVMTVTENKTNRASK